MGGPFQISVNEISFGSCTERAFAMYEFTGFLFYFYYNCKLTILLGQEVHEFMKTSSLSYQGSVTILIGQLQVHDLIRAALGLQTYQDNFRITSLSGQFQVYDIIQTTPSSRPN